MRRLREFISRRDDELVERLAARVAKDEDDVRVADTRRRVVQLVVAAPLLVVTLAVSVTLFNHPSEVPKLQDPGLIAVADTTESKSPLQVYASYDGRIPESTYGLLAINTYATPDMPRHLVVIVCGQIGGEGTRVSDVNSGGATDLLELMPLPGSGNSDSVLGDYSLCKYTAIKTTSFQVLLRVISTDPIAEQSNDRMLYALPRLTTVLPHAATGDLELLPWPAGTTIQVDLENVADDFRLDNSLPAIQASGDLSWRFEQQNDGQLAPRQYRISGTLLEATDEASRRTFVAGVLAGVSGAALIWVLEVAISLAFRPRR